MNNLWVFWKEEEPAHTRGFHCVNVTESYHPYYENWWPHGHIFFIGGSIHKYFVGKVKVSHR